jgi:hypothetical protein
LNRPAHRLFFGLSFLGQGNDEAIELVGSSRPNLCSTGLGYRRPKYSYAEVVEIACDESPKAIQNPNVSDVAVKANK